MQTVLPQSAPGFAPPEEMSLTIPTPAEIEKGLGPCVEDYMMELIPKAEASLLTLACLPTAQGGLDLPQGSLSPTRTHSARRASSFTSIG